MNDHAENWLGQKLHVGDHVYRGARDGNSSSFKVGVVTKLDKFTVNWLYEPDGMWQGPRGDQKWVSYIRKMDSVGRPDPDSCVLVDPWSVRFLKNNVKRWDPETRSLVRA